MISITESLILKINELESRIRYLERLEKPIPGSIPSTFLDLSDTPSSYSGAAGDLVAVNSTPNGLEFVGDYEVYGAALTYNGTASISSQTYTLIPFNSITDPKSIISSGYFTNGFGQNVWVLICGSCICSASWSIDEEVRLAVNYVGSATVRRLGVWNAPHAGTLYGRASGAVLLNVANGSSVGIYIWTQRAATFSGLSTENWGSFLVFKQYS